MIEKVLFALGSVIAFEGFFLAIIPERLKKTLSQISIISIKAFSDWFSNDGYWDNNYRCNRYLDGFT